MRDALGMPWYLIHSRMGISQAFQLERRIHPHSSVDDAGQMLPVRFEWVPSMSTTTCSGAPRPQRTGCPSPNFEKPRWKDSSKEDSNPGEKAVWCDTPATAAVGPFLLFWATRKIRRRRFIHSCGHKITVWASLEAMVMY